MMKGPLGGKSRGVDSVLDSTALKVQQQMIGLLHTCEDRARNLKMPHLVAVSRMTLVKFELQHVSQLEGGVEGQLGTQPLKVLQVRALGRGILFCVRRRSGIGFESDTFPIHS